MPVDFLGVIGVKTSRSNAAMHIVGGSIDHDSPYQFSKAHEDSDFEGVLVGYISGAADRLHFAQDAARQSTPGSLTDRCSTPGSTDARELQPQPTKLDKTEKLPSQVPTKSMSHIRFADRRLQPFR